ncbi:hypothetical protein [Cohnella caldifontis]|uniref:hypothetical protein n=1 Tax=Cohnella caldifontis TaxID=3027471 RepID=UPI0023EC9CEF|nr:hypothetical protein [Cohnella sp. YIM B05605]
MDKNKEQEEAERLLAERLTEGEPISSNPQEEAVRRLPPRWEIRIQTERDPVAEETAKYRTMAKEVDGRYDDRSGGQ